MNRNIRTQLALRGENAKSIAKQIDRSYTYVLSKLDEKTAWQLSDLEHLSQVWNIPIFDFFKTTVDLNDAPRQDP